VSVLCDWLAVNRAGYYRWLAAGPSQPVEMELRDAMQQIAVKFPACGYRRITAELNRSGSRSITSTCCV